ncbi:hypothetical protein ACFE04_013915 [Oxalis oulophora]
MFSDSDDPSSSFCRTLDCFSFPETILNNNFLVVAYRCADCDDFTPTYEKVSQLLDGQIDDLILAKYDAEEYNDIIVVGCVHPTLITFKNRGDQVHEYNGPLLNAQEIVDWLARLSDHALSAPPIHALSAPPINAYDLKSTAVTHYNNDTPERVAYFFAGIDDNSKVMLFIDPNSEHVDEFVNEYFKVAINNAKNDISFMLGEIEASQDAFQFFKLHKGGKAPFIVFQTIEGDTYWKEKMESVDDIQAFMRNCKNNQPVQEVFVENFSAMVMDSEKNVLLELGPWCEWCEHCNTLAPVLDGVATNINDPNVVVAKLYKNDKDIRRKGLNNDPYAAKDCPILYFKRAHGKKLTSYHGLRTEGHIKKFIEINRDKDTKYKTVEIKSLREVDCLTQDKKIVIVGVFSIFSGQEYDNFNEAADKLRLDFEFRILDAKNLSNVQRAPVVMLFNPFLSDNMNKFDAIEKFDLHALKKFIKAASLPFVTVYDEHPKTLVNNFFHSNYDDAKAMLFINRSGEDAQIFISKYIEVAKKHRGNGIIFMLGDLEDSRDAYEYFDLEKSQKPLLVILSSLRHRYLKENLEHTDEIEALVKDYKYISADDLVKFVDEVSGTHSCSITDKAVLFNNMGEEFLESRFKKVSKTCEEQGIELFSEDLEAIDHALYFNTDHNELIMVIMNSMKELSLKEYSGHMDGIESWVKDYKEGKVGKYRKFIRPMFLRMQFMSGDTVFRDLVMNSGENVLLVMYSDEWINSEVLQSVLQDVAFHFTKEKEKQTDLFIAQMNWAIVTYDPIVQYALCPVSHRLKTISDYDEIGMSLRGAPDGARAWISWQVNDVYELTYFSSNVQEGALIADQKKNDRDRSDPVPYTNICALRANEDQAVSSKCTLSPTYYSSETNHVPPRVDQLIHVAASFVSPPFYFTSLTLKSPPQLMRFAKRDPTYFTRNQRP